MRWRKSHKMQLIEWYTVLLMGIVKFCEVKTTYTLKLIMNVEAKSLDKLRGNLTVICRIFTFYFRRHLKISAKNNLHFAKPLMQSLQNGLRSVSVITSMTRSK